MSLSNRQSRGFTLVELLVVIGIIALLIAILLPVLGRARAASNELKCASNIRQLCTALVNYAAEWRGKFPPNINRLIYTGFPPAGAPISNLWYDEDRVGEYLPKGVQPSDTSTDKTVGGGVFVCPSDLENAQRSYSMNLWASSMTDQQFLNKSPQGLIYASDSAGYDPEPPFRGEFWNRGSSSLILISEAHPRNTVARGFYANASIGYQGEKAGERFLGIPSYMIGSGDFGGGPYPNADHDTELAYYKHRRDNQRDNNPNSDTAWGRVNIGFADAHVEMFSHDELADVDSGKSKYVALWSPYDQETEDSP